MTAVPYTLRFVDHEGVEVHAEPSEPFNLPLRVERFGRTYRMHFVSDKVREVEYREVEV